MLSFSRLVTSFLQWLVPNKHHELSECRDSVFCGITKRLITINTINTITLQVALGVGKYPVLVYYISLCLKIIDMACLLVFQQLNNHPYHPLGGVGGCRVPSVGLPHCRVLLPPWTGCQRFPHNCHHPGEIPGIKYHVLCNRYQGTRDQVSSTKCRDTKYFV